MKWSEATTVEFVELYLKHECLWNPEDPSYKIKSTREQAYSNIGESFKQCTGINVSTCEVKRKIKNLRTTYSQQVHKIVTRTRDPDSLYRPSLVWFSLMDARLKHISNKHLHNAAYTSTYDKESHDDTSDKAWLETEIADDYSHCNPFLLPPAQESREEKARPVRVKSEPRMTRRHTFKVKKKKLKSHRETISPACNSSSDMEQSSKPLAPPTEDEFDIYGKHIAAQLRRMDLHKALRLQMQINSMISDARLGEFEGG